MAYTKEWYEKNKEVIAARRRKQYHEDPEHRAALLAQCKKYRERKVEERAQFLANPYIFIGKVKVPAVTVDTLIEDIGIDLARLKWFQKAKYIPRALVNRPIRLYTHRQVKMIAELEEFLLVHSHNLRSTRTEEGQLAQAGLKELVSTIHQDWRKP